MNIYDETTRELVTDPDLSAGYVYDGVIVTGRTEERIEVMEGTVTEDRPEGLRRLIPAQDIIEPCQWYHKYTEEELSAMHGGDFEERLSAVEKNVEDAKEGLTAAKIMLGVE